MRRRALAFLALLSAFLALPACAAYTRVASTAVTTIGAAELVAARAGAEAHRLEVEALTAEAKGARVALGCGEAGPPPYPPGCREAEWVEAREGYRARLDAAKERYRSFRIAMLTLDAALTEVALATKVYEETQGEFNLAGAVSGLLRAWGTVAALLREYGVEPPAIPDLGGAR